MTFWQEGTQTITDLRNAMHQQIAVDREERGEAFDIEGALRLTQSRILLAVYQPMVSEYRAELQRKYLRDPTRCRYCGNSLELYPGLGNYCDICSDKFMDGEPHETEEECDD